MDKGSRRVQAQRRRKGLMVLYVESRAGGREGGRRERGAEGCLLCVALCFGRDDRKRE